jgi:hypothetical protein
MGTKYRRQNKKREVHKSKRRGNHPSSLKKLNEEEKLERSKLLSLKPTIH